MEMHFFMISTFVLLVVPPKFFHIKVALIKKEMMNDKNGKSFLYL